MIRVAETDADKQACFDLRRQVFVGEQGVTEAEEVDGLDPEATHVLLRVGDTPIGTMRLRIVEGMGKVERVCVSPDHRSDGHGADLIRWAIGYFRKGEKVKGVKLGAQVRAIGFYEALGFEAYGPEYLDARIPHRDMRVLFS
mgnify:CR=1 FL=1